jgi:thiamine biosynthesis protein ThiI
MNEVILLKHGEIILKGQNKRSFENKLIGEIKSKLKGCGDFEITSAQSTVYLTPKGPNCDLDMAIQAMSRVFGIAAIARAVESPKDTASIIETAKLYLREPMEKAESFKVETKRADKRFPLNSIQLSQLLGGQLHQEYPHVRVDVHNPDFLVNLEIRETAAYIHGQSIPGAGGLPIGTSGRAVTLLSGGIDSPVSSHMIAKRGVHLIPVHFHSFPYTSELSKEKVITLTKQLSLWCGPLTLEVVPFTRIQEEIIKNCPDEYLTIIMRRFMMRISQMIADRNGCGALVTGENLGQVASQTMESLAVTEDCATLPVLRPLIGMDKEEIIRLARKIGTFETSILPYEDCCSLFTPRRPKTKPKLAAVQAAESKLNVQELTSDAFNLREQIKLG